MPTTSIDWRKCQNSFSSLIFEGRISENEERSTVSILCHSSEVSIEISVRSMKFPRVCQNLTMLLDCVSPSEDQVKSCVSIESVEESMEMDWRFPFWTLSDMNIPSWEPPPPFSATKWNFNRFSLLKISKGVRQSRRGFLLVDFWTKEIDSRSEIISVDDRWRENSISTPNSMAAISRRKRLREVSFQISTSIQLNMPSITILMLLVASSAMMTYGRSMASPDQLMPFIFSVADGENNGLPAGGNSPSRFIQVVEQIIK